MIQIFGVFFLLVFILAGGELDVVNFVFMFWVLGKTGG